MQTPLHPQNKGNQWYIDSGFSSHMTDDKNKSLTLKEVDEGSVAFGLNATTMIDRKGTLTLNNEKNKTEKCLVC